MRYVLYQGIYREGQAVEVSQWIVSEKRLHVVREKRMRRAMKRFNGKVPEFVERSGVGWYQPWGWRVVGEGVEVSWRVRGYHPWLKGDSLVRSPEEVAKLWAEFFDMNGKVAA